MSVLSFEDIVRYYRHSCPDRTSTKTPRHDYRF